MKYGLEKRIRLQAGTHQHIFWRSRRELYQDGDRQLAGGQILYLRIPPIYPRYKWGHPASQLGLLGFNAVFNNTSNN